jgi:hypothetical protein
VRSGGGGCCDCGDPSAWAPAGCCSRHRAGPYARPSCDLVQTLGALEARLCKLVVQCVVSLLSACLGSNALPCPGGCGEGYLPGAPPLASCALCLSRTLRAGLVDPVFQEAEALCAAYANSPGDNAGPHAVLLDSPASSDLKAFALLRREMAKRAGGKAGGSHQQLARLAERGRLVALVSPQPQASLVAQSFTKLTARALAPTPLAPASLFLLPSRALALLAWLQALCAAGQSLRGVVADALLSELPDELLESVKAGHSWVCQPVALVPASRDWLLHRDPPFPSPALPRSPQPAPSPASPTPTAELKVERGLEQLPAGEPWSEEAVEAWLPVARGAACLDAWLAAAHLTPPELWRALYTLLFSLLVEPGFKLSFARVLVLACCKSTPPTPRLCWQVRHYPCAALRVAESKPAGQDAQTADDFSLQGVGVQVCVSRRVAASFLSLPITRCSPLRR